MSEERLPPHVLTEIASPMREYRLMGVGELAQLANSPDLALAADARLALQRLAEDDSRSVAAAAATALGRTAMRVRPDRVDFGEVPHGTPHLIADVHVDGPPLAVAEAKVTASGPGLRAALRGSQLRILWQPRSAWLDGSVTVHGPAGWAEVRVTGQVLEAEPEPHAGVAAQLRAEAGFTGGTAARVTVLPAAPARRHRGTSVLIAGLTGLVLLGGAGVAVAMTTNDDGDPSSVALIPAPTATPSSARATGPAATPGVLTRVPLAARVRSVARPTVMGTVPAGNEPEGVAVAPDARTVYVADQSAHVLSVVDAATRKVTSVALRHTPRFVTTSRDGRLVFVSMYEDDKSGSGVAVIDAPARKVLRYIATGVQPYTLAVGPDDRLWVPIHGLGRVEIYAAADQRPAGQVTVPPNPHAVAFSGALMRAFTPNHESNEVAVIDMRTDRMLKSIPVSKAPHSVAVSPDGTTVLVAGYEANTADLIDARTMKRTGPFRVGKQPQSVAFATDGAHAYVVNEGDDTVSVLDGRTGATTATLHVGRSPRTIAVAPDGRLAYVSNGDDDTVSVLQVGA